MDTEAPVYYSNIPASPGGTPVHVLRRDGAVEDLDPRTDLANHSPSGFSWGYRGSGPAQLALAVLADCCSEETALREYQDFKDAVVAGADGDEKFRVTAADVEEHLR